MEWISFNMGDFGVKLAKVLIAFVLALPIAWEREASTKLMGLRTFPIVAIASCAFVMIGRDLAGTSAEANARIIQGLMTGIGFIGGGAILKRDETVRGTATAASIWGTAATGAAVGFEDLEIAMLVSLCTFATLRLLTPIKYLLKHRHPDTRDEDLEQDL